MSSLTAAVLSPKARSHLIIVAAFISAALLGQQASARFLILSVSGLGLLVLLRRPALGLVALAALSFTVPIAIGTGTEVALTPPVFIIPVIAGAWLLEGFHSRTLRPPRSRAVLPLALFVLSGLISLLAGRAYWDPQVPLPGNFTLVQLGQWAIFALSGLIFLLAGALGRRERLLEAATWTFLALASVVVLEFFVPPLRRVLGWSAGTMANRSLFWTWLGALGAGQLLFNRKASVPVKVWLAVLLAGAAYIVWFEMSIWTSGWAPYTLAVAGTVLFWLWRRKRILAIVALLLLIVVAVWLAPAAFSHTGGQEEMDMTWGGRLRLYQTTLDLIKEHPILGLGPAAYRHYGFAQWLSMGVGRALWIRPNVSSHNNYIDIYAQMGLVGLGLFVWFLVEVGWLAVRSVRRFEGDFEAGYVQGARAGFLATLFAMMLADWFLPFVYNIGFPGFRTSALAWMFLGGLVALEQQSEASTTLANG
jgi:O-antigen ligase